MTFSVSGPVLDPAEQRDVDPDDRLRGAVWGQLVGDAAALGTHWIYDLDDLEVRFPGGPQGFEAPHAGHYHHGKNPGDQTHYGDGALTLLRSVTEGGAFDVTDFGRRFVSTFNPVTYRGYLDHATTGTLANYRAAVDAGRQDTFDFQAGADDDQPATATRLAVLVGWARTEPVATLYRQVDALTRVAQRNDRALVYNRFVAAVLHQLLAGQPVDASLDAGSEALEGLAAQEVATATERIGLARAAAGKDTVAAALAFGQSCPLEHSVPAAVQVLVTFPDDFRAAVLATLRAGGDNAARAAIIGAWAGASLGVSAVPQAWIDRLSAHGEVRDRIERLVGASRA